MTDPGEELSAFIKHSPFVPKYHSNAIQMMIKLHCKYTCLTFKREMKITDPHANYHGSKEIRINMLC